MKGRDRKKRNKTFFNDHDMFHKRLELLRQIFYHPTVGVKEACLQFGISPTSYYRLVKDYSVFGPWAVIPGNLPGKETMSNETELDIILQKLRYPHYSAQEMVNVLKLRCSRYAVNRVFSRWALTDRDRPAHLLWTNSAPRNPAKSLSNRQRPPITFTVIPPFWNPAGSTGSLSNYAAKCARTPISCVIRALFFWLSL